jgi:FkbM family methyltransferase
LHRKRGNEVYPYACGQADLDGQDFEIAHRDGDYEKDQFTDHSFSALRVKEAYKIKEPSFYQLEIIKTKVDVRKLDTILAAIGVEEISFLSVDVEGWELEVMLGFSVQKYRPKVILLENFLHAPEYVEFMTRLGYPLVGRIEYNYLFSPSTNIWNSASARRKTLADP